VNVWTVAEITPPMIVRASGAFASAPGPPIAMGRSASHAQNEAIGTWIPTACFVRMQEWG